jgi:uncharacterized membrane protein
VKSPNVCCINSLASFSEPASFAHLLKDCGLQSLRHIHGGDIRLRGEHVLIGADVPPTTSDAIKKKRRRRCLMQQKHAKTNDFRQSLGPGTKEMALAGRKSSCWVFDVRL